MGDEAWFIPGVTIHLTGGQWIGVLCRSGKFFSIRLCKLFQYGPCFVNRPYSTKMFVEIWAELVTLNKICPHTSAIKSIILHIPCAYVVI